MNSLLETNIISKEDLEDERISEERMWKIRKKDESDDDEEDKEEFDDSEDKKIREVDQLESESK